MKTSHILDSRHGGVRISVMMSVPEGTPKAVVQIVHGMCEYKERYTPFIDYLTDKGYVCVIHDHRGHGKSAATEEDLGFFGPKGEIALIDDIKVVNEWISEQYPGLKIILFGHSMGSMGVRSYIKRHDDTVAGLIVCGSPSKNPLASLGRMLASLFGWINGKHSRPKLLQSLSFGAFNKKFRHEMDNAWICSDQEVVKAYNKDPLCNYQFTADGFRALSSLMMDAYSPKGWKKSSPDLPVLFIAGEDDPCIVSKERFDKAVNFIRKAGYTDVQSKTYPGMRHEILNEKDKETVWKDVLSFIEKCISCDKK